MRGEGTNIHMGELTTVKYWEWLRFQIWGRKARLGSIMRVIYFLMEPMAIELA